MATGEYLPPVVTRLTGDLGDFRNMIAEAKALLKSLGGEANVALNIKTDGLKQAAAQVTALKKALSDLNGTVKVGTDGLGGVAAKAAAAAAATRQTTVSDLEAAKAEYLLAMAQRMRANTANDAIKATRDLNAATATGAAAGGRLFGGAAFGLTANALHWIIAGGAEILAVTVPAIIALAAGLAVMAPAAQQAAQHMQALNTATQASNQMFGQTIGDVLGLGHALQTAQDAAQPAVYGALGSALLAVKGHLGGLASTGLQVAQMFQTFAAKVAVDFGPGGSLGGTVNTLLAHMTSDLRGLGQMFGNAGHAVLTFAAQMPGLAEVLLGAVAGITGLISKGLEFASKFQVMGVSIITLAMGFEEFNRWGGLAANVFTKLGIGAASLTGGPFSFARMGSVIQGLLSVFPMLIAYVARLVTYIPGLGGLAAGMTGMAEGLAGGIEALGPFQAALAGAALIGLGVFIYKVLTARSATQQFTDSLQQATLKASNVQAFQQIAQNIGQINAKLVQVAQTAPRVVSGLGRGAYVEVNPAIAQLNQGLTQQEQDLRNVAQGAAYLAATYHTNLVGALALADLANVKLANGILGTGQAATIARMQIASLVQGYMAMGQPLTAVGSDMTALAIQSGLASSQVSKLNQAWDQFMQNLTGGTSALAGFVTSLSNIGSVVASFHNNLGRALSIKDSVNQFAQALKSFGTNGAAAWQNFDQVVGSTAPQLIDWLRTAGAEGALSGKQFTQAVMGMVSALVPLASQSQTAQAEVLGLVAQVDPSINTWNKLTTALKNDHASLKDTTSAVQDATKKMGDMAQVAQNLGTIMQSALLTALSQAKIAASGAGSAMQQYEQDIMNAGTAASKTASDRAALIGDLEKLGYSAKQAAQLVQLVANNIGNLHDKTVTVTVNTVATGTTVGGGGGQRITHHAAGTPSAPAGWSWVGEAGPELVKFRGGETVLPNSVSRGFAEGAYAGGDIHVHISLDGRQIASAVATRAVQSQRRTGHNGMQKRSR